MENRVIIYKRIKELKKEIDNYYNLLNLDNNDSMEKFYRNKIAELQAIKNLNEAIYYGTGKSQ